jgi:hypothetical protein
MMKRLMFVLPALVFFSFFSAPAFAVDLKISGEFFAAGVYLDKTTLTKDSGVSTAFYFQRLRVRTDFIVSPGLSLVTRFDAMDRAWGADRSTSVTTIAVDSAGSAAENQNIAFDWAYINYQSPIGIFAVGYYPDGTTGTIFGNSYSPVPRINWTLEMGPWTLSAYIAKTKDGSYTAINNTVTTSDLDKDKYSLQAYYSWKDGRAGLSGIYYRYADARQSSNYVNSYYLLTPYAWAKIGPVDIQTEINYAWGKAKAYDNGTNDIAMTNLSCWIDATATFGPVYFGGTLAYVSGDDPGTTDKQEGGTLNGGRDWSPTLIMWNYDRSMWIGEIASSATTGKGFGTSGLTNAFLYQGRIGVRPTEKLDIMTSFTFANADKKPANYVSDQYGYELDVTATYKITNNLTYMIGAGYLWTGDYFKGTNTANAVQNDYMVINKMTLTF